MARSRCFCCCLPGCLLAVLIPGAGFLWLLRQAGQEPESALPPKTYTPAQARQARQHIEHAEAVQEKAERAARNNKRVPFQISLTEDDLNAYLTADPEMSRKMQREGWSDVRVDLGNGTVTVQGSGRIPALDARVWMVAEGVVEAGDRGRILFQPTNIEFGRLRLKMPDTVKKQMMDDLRKQSDNGIFQVPADIKELKIGDDKIVVKGVSNPDILKEIEASREQPEEQTGG